MKQNLKRNIALTFRVNQEERELINKRIYSFNLAWEIG